MLVTIFIALCMGVCFVLVFFIVFSLRIHALCALVYIFYNIYTIRAIILLDNLQKNFYFLFDNSFLRDYTLVEDTHRGYINSLQICLSKRNYL